ncbi:DUF2892 domain-containing protein [Aestuariibacter sp. AA17]|uniref:DUF2892 domain-containing protein n=1 Tax=Fluctibacter corallii TaxID=2984329 RepID=A0ABT3ACT3_9ALTE|nr:DUF2892 domain-containing protein [Aestuariibacter sp. AA17]MCV2886434.1 DUF2892 domain-containing protein [Aestuariibacter sp. AA17]
MKQNVGILDTAIRSIIACVLLTLAVQDMYSTATNVALVIVGLALWVSCSTGVCYIYKMLGIDTYPDFSDDSYAGTHK